MKLILANKKLAVFALALLLRLGYSLNIDKAYVSLDSTDWNKSAFALLDEGRFESTFRGPATTVFLAGIYGVFGRDVTPVRVAQSILGAATCLFILSIGTVVFFEQAGLVAALIAAGYPYFIHLTGDILSETLLTFLIALYVMLYFSSLGSKKPSAYALCGVSAGAALLCKGTFLPFFALSLVWVLVSMEDRFRERAKAALLIGLFAAAAVSPWTARNFYAYGKFVPLGLGGESLWLANNPQAYKLETLPEMDQDKLDPAFTWYDSEKLKEISKLPAIAADREFQKEAVSYIKAEPRKFSVLAVKRFAHFWRLSPLIATKRNKMIALATSGIILPLGWAGMLLSFRRYWRKSSVLIMLPLSFSLIHMVFLAHIRYRIPCDPYIIVFAAFTLCTLFNKLSRRQEWQA